MPNLKTYYIFISHAWKYNSEYYRLVEMLSNAPYFKWKNFSVPEHDPLLDPNDEHDRETLLKELDEQIRPVHCVIILSGMYAHYSYWIRKEIEIAENYGKSIIGIKPWGQERVPVFVQEKADVIVGWNTTSIVDAIRKFSL